VLVKGYPVVTVLGFSVNVVTGITMVFVVTYVVGFSPILVFVAMTTVESVCIDVVKAVPYRKSKSFRWMGPVEEAEYNLVEFGYSLVEWYRSPE
jgi:hypothetical protein